MHPDAYDFWLSKVWPNDPANLVRQFWPWAKPLLYNDHIIYSDRPFFKKYRGSNILIVGGGPSTRDLNWEQYQEDSDYLWSCNHYFQSDKLVNLRVDLAMIMPEVSLYDQLFLFKAKLDCTHIGIESHDKYFNNLNLRFFVEKYGKENCFYSMSRFFSYLGVGARMMILAASVGASNISFVGFDGPVPGHAFEAGKFKLPPSVPPDKAYDIYMYQYNQLWDHLIVDFPGSKVTSVDKTNKFHEKVW